jgi:hypothetical protein
MNALYVGDVDIFVPICDIKTAYEPLDSFLFYFTVGDLPEIVKNFRF